jgi:hypothetical protein
MALGEDAGSFGWGNFKTPDQQAHDRRVRHLREKGIIPVMLQDLQDTINAAKSRLASGREATDFKLVIALQKQAGDSNPLSLEIYNIDNEKPETALLAVSRPGWIGAASNEVFTDAASKIADHLRKKGYNIDQQAFDGNPHTSTLNLTITSEKPIDKKQWLTDVADAAKIYIRFGRDAGKGDLTPP